MTMRTAVILAVGIAAACALATGAPAAANTPAAWVAVVLAVPGGVTGVAAHGNIAAAISKSGRSVTIIDAAVPSVRSTMALPDAPSGVALSPDGSLAYVASGHEIVVVDTVTGALARSGAYDNEAMPDRVTGGQKPCVSTNQYVSGMQLRSPATSPDGRLLYFVGDCQEGPAIWSIDPATMLVVKKAFTYSGRGGLGMPNGPLAAFDDQAIVTGVHPDDYCLDAEDCGPTPIVITSNGDTYKGFQYAKGFAAGPFSALTRDPVAGTLLASKDQSLVWVDPASGAQVRSIDGVGSSFTDLKVDPTTGLVYGRDGQGTVVVDPVAGRALGMIMTTLDAVAAGRGYHGTDTGIDLVDLGAGLVPTRPLAVTASIGRAVQGKVKATVTWQAPASAGSSPVTGYWVRAYSRRSAADKKPWVLAYRLGPRTTSVTYLRQVTTTNPKHLALYSFTVTPINAVGEGASGSTQVTAPRK